MNKRVLVLVVAIAPFVVAVVAWKQNTAARARMVEQRQCFEIWRNWSEQIEWLDKQPAAGSVEHALERERTRRVAEEGMREQERIARERWGGRPSDYQLLPPGG